MDSRKADLVIKYNLHWKNAPKSSTKNRVNIVGMCDLSTSSRNLEQFKSYLLKNSGATGDDVKVSYIGDEDKEFPIETQEDFHTALNYFREVARSGNTITLKLESVFYKNKADLLKRSVSSSDDSLRDSNEAEHWYQVIKPNVDMFSEKAPQWFTEYMTEFKNDLVKEISNAVLKSVSGMKPKNTISTNTPPENAPVKQIRKKHKVKSSLLEIPNSSSMSRKKMKAGRNFVKASGDNIVAEKNALKEQKLDQKLAKLENKTLKIKAKKAMLQMKLGAESSRSNKHHHQHHSHPNHQPTDTFAAEIENLMGAIPIRQRETTIPRMLGGQILEHEWEVMNTGQLPWTAETELHYAWGSEALRPLHHNYNCPYLQPGEKGIVKVQLKIPKKPGKYESYWYFHHLGRRFGHWLGCQVIVDHSHFKNKHCSIEDSNLSPSEEPKPLKLKSEIINLPKRDAFDSPISFVDNLPPVDDPSFTALEISKLIDDLKGKICNCETMPGTATNNSNTLDDNKEINLKISDVNLNKQEKELLQKDILDIDTKLVGLKICNSDDGSTTSDSDNQSIASASESNTTSGSEMSGEFVLIKKPAEVVQEESSDKNNNNNEADVDTKPKKSDSSFVLEIPSDDSEVEDYIKINKTIIPLPIVRVQVEKKSDKNDNQKTEEIKNEANEEVTTDDQTKSENHSLCEEGVEANENTDILERTCITVDGVQMLVPTKFLRRDFLNKMESSTNSDNQAEATKENAVDISSKTPKTNDATAVDERDCVQVQMVPVKDDLDNARNTQSIYMSAASTPDVSLSSMQGNASSENGKSTIEADAKKNSGGNRLFVFPQSCPGFEVVYPSNTTDSFIGYSVNNSNVQAPIPYQSDVIAWISHNSGNPETASSFYPVENLSQTHTHSPSGGAYPSYDFQHQQFSYPNYVQQQTMFNGFPQYSHVPSYNTNNATAAIRTLIEEQESKSYCMPNNGSNFASSAPFTEAFIRQRATVDATGTTHHPSNVAEQPRIFSRTPSSAGSFTVEQNSERTSSLNTSNNIQRETSTSSPVESPLVENAAPVYVQSPPISETMRDPSRHSGFKGILPNSVTAVPENIVTGAVNVASSAINTARSVLSMFNPEPGTWINGHWVPRDLDSRRERALRILDEMGFRNRDYNATLLARYNDDITQVISELVQ